MMQAIFSIGKELFGGLRESGLRIRIHTERAVRYPVRLHPILRRIFAGDSDTEVKGIYFRRIGGDA